VLDLVFNCPTFMTFENNIDQVHVLNIDNGEDSIQIDLDTLRSDLSHAGISQVVITNVVEKMRAYAEEVAKEKTNGVHLGSSELNFALESELWPKQSGDAFVSEIGLQTETEQKLVATLIGRACKKNTQ
jgi:hypothetical protein